MPIRGQIECVPPIEFELPDTPLLHGGLSTESVSISGTEPRVIIWAAHHEKGRFYLKRKQVGIPLAFIDLPKMNHEYALADPVTNVRITVTRSRF